VEPGQQVLDLGCGDGAFAAALARAGAQVVGVDVAENALARAGARPEQLDLRLWQGSEPLPVNDASVDVVWAGEVVEHVVDVAAWLSEVRRVLRPRGSLLLSTPSHGRLRMVAIALARMESHFDPRGEHVRFFTARSLRELLEDFGFEEIRLRLTGGVPLLRATIMATARRRRWG